MASEAPQGCTPTEPKHVDDAFDAVCGSVGIKVDSNYTYPKNGTSPLVWLHLDGMHGSSGFWAAADELRGIATMLADYADELDGAGEIRVLITPEGERALQAFVDQAGKDAGAIRSTIIGVLGQDIPAWLKA